MNQLDSNAGQAHSQVNHDPSQVDSKVLTDNKADEHRSHPYTPQPPIYIIERNNRPASIRLTDGDFEDESGDGNEEDGE